MLNIWWLWCWWYVQYGLGRGWWSLWNLSREYWKWLLWCWFQPATWNRWMPQCLRRSSKWVFKWHLLLISYYLKCWNGDCSIFLITNIYLDSYICTCLPGFSATEVNENGAAKCEADCDSNNGICQLDAHCPQECSCPSGYEVVNWFKPGQVLNSSSLFQRNSNHQCEDINECTKHGSNNMCPRSMNSCQNTDGSYECKCTHSNWYKKESGDCIQGEILTI